MPIVKAENHIDVYKWRARAADIHELSGRGTNHHLTKFINDTIIRQLAFSTADVVVDIGCGDGSLLSKLMPSVASAIGVAPTVEEVDRLRQTWVTVPQLSFRVGTAQNVPVDDAIATRVVCNGVFILFNHDADAHRALEELARIARPGALVWLGEIPDVDENASARIAYGNSLLRWIAYLTRRDGVSAGIRAAYRVARARVTQEPFIVQPKRLYVRQRAQLLSMIEQYPFEVLWSGRHRERAVDGTEHESSTRNDYLLRRR